MEPPRSDDTNAHTPQIEGMPGPRWSRNTGIYPTSLRRYLECPHRCRLEYVDKIPYDRPWTREIEVGNALHKIMERIANSLHNQHVPPPIGSFRSWIGRDLLPKREYERPDDHIEDIDKVLEWAHRGTRYITHGNPTILRVEKHFPRHWEERGELGKVLLGAKADLVVLRRGKTGRYVEIIDYKTGFSRRWTQFTPILSSIALKPRIHAALPDQQHPRVMFSYLWFAHGDHERIPLTAERQSDEWAELKHILVRLVNEEEWPKRPNPKVCQYCPYYNRQCTPFPEMAVP